VLAAVVFVATSGHTWPAPLIFGACRQAAYRHFTDHDCGRLFPFDPSCPFQEKVRERHRDF